jgi:hypothetical protein
MRMLNGTGVVMQSAQEGSTQSPPLNVLGANTPVAYYQPIAITPATIKWLCAGAVAWLALMPSGFLDRYLSPAKDSDLKALTAIVQVLQQGQADTAKAVERLTLAVDNMSGILAEVKNRPARVVLPKAAR